jgi:hypothetical protein
MDVIHELCAEELQTEEEEEEEGSHAGNLASICTHTSYTQSGSAGPITRPRHLVTKPSPRHSPHALTLAAS